MCNADRHQQVGTVESLHLIENYYSKSHRIVLCVQRRRRSLSNGFQNGTTLPRRVHPLNVLQFAISPYFDILILFFSICTDRNLTVNHPLGINWWPHVAVHSTYIEWKALRAFHLLPRHVHMPFAAQFQPSARWKIYCGAWFVAYQRHFRARVVTWWESCVMWKVECPKMFSFSRVWQPAFNINLCKTYP